MTTTQEALVGPSAHADERLPHAPVRRRRRRGLARLGGLAAALAVAVVVTTSDRPAAGPECGTVGGRALAELQVFTSWLDEHDVDGVIGEVGWPSTSSQEWEAVATPWLAHAIDSGAGVYVWGAAEQWDPTYPLAVYRYSPERTVVAGSQARLVESMVAPAAGDGVAALRGVALAGPSFGAHLDETPSSYSARYPGVRGADYVYPSWRFLVRLSERGITSVRLAVMWERLQPEPFGPLDDGGLAELRRVLHSADQLGMSVVLDLHNYGRYAVGSEGGGRRLLQVGTDELPAAALADLWRSVASSVGSEPALAAYGLMNEPHGLEGGSVRWEQTTREVVAAIRTVDRTTLVLVPGYGWSAAAAWRQNHPQPWIDDPNVAYEAHQYFDADRTGHYRRPFEDEAALAAAAVCAD